MRIYVFSDSHGNGTDMLAIIEKSRPDMIIHLGDGRADVEKIESQFPQTPLIAVRGNCDFGSKLPDKEVLNINGVKLLLTHGYTYKVKSGVGPLLKEGRFLGASLVLFGHTHAALFEDFGGIKLLNPGSCGEGYSRSYAEVIISNPGEYDCRIIKV